MTRRQRGVHGGAVLGADGELGGRSSGILGPALHLEGRLSLLMLRHTIDMMRMVIDKINKL